MSILDSLDIKLKHVLEQSAHLVSPRGRFHHQRNLLGAKVVKLIMLLLFH